jgi:hypothetical protein
MQSRFEQYKAQAARLDRFREKGPVPLGHVAPLTNACEAFGKLNNSALPRGNGKWLNVRMQL